jgi:hypothetical protein
MQLSGMLCGKQLHLPTSSLVLLAELPSAAPQQHHQGRDLSLQIQASSIEMTQQVLRCWVGWCGYSTPHEQYTMSSTTRAAAAVLALHKLLLRHAPNVGDAGYTSR